MARVGVLITGFGGPDSLDAVAPFMCNLMGREPSEELVSRVCRRYLAIGGSSPLPEIAAKIAEKLFVELQKQGTPMPVEVGMRYWHPYIDDSMERLKAVGCDTVVNVSLSPFESKVASDACRVALAESAEKLGMQVVDAPLVSTHVEFVDFLAGAAATALTDIEQNDGAILAFTAHSLPLSDVAEDDPYVAGLKLIAQMVASKLGLDPGYEDVGEGMFESFRAFGSTVPPRAWFLVYQSKGERPGGWLEPDLDALIDAASQTGVTGIVVCPIGFMTDHMETLYDLDIVAADRALQAGLGFQRAYVPNDDDDLIAAIARSVAELFE